MGKGDACIYARYVCFAAELIGLNGKIRLRRAEREFEHKVSSWDCAGQRLWTILDVLLGNSVFDVVTPVIDEFVRMGYGGWR